MSEFFLQGRQEPLVAAGERGARQRWRKILAEMAGYGYSDGHYKKDSHQAATNAGIEYGNALTLPNLYRIRISRSALLYRPVTRVKGLKMR